MDHIKDMIWNHASSSVIFPPRHGRVWTERGLFSVLLRGEFRRVSGHHLKPGIVQTSSGSASGKTVRRKRDSLRVGFVPLLDAAPLIVACELGYFASRGLAVELERQVGWGNVRDKLSFGHLDASHALLGIPVVSALQSDPDADHLVSILSLGTGGDAITLSRRLTNLGINSAATLQQHIRTTKSHELLTFGYVFSSSVHHYLLRDWLARGGIRPDLDVRLAVVPPSQTAEQTARGYLDGFCVGEPWNTLAMHRGAGTIVALTTDIVPAHPDKVLAVRKSQVLAKADQFTALLDATLQACAFCDDVSNHHAIAEMLASPRYLDLPLETILTSLQLDRTFNLKPSLQHFRATDWHMRSLSPESTRPTAKSSRWLLDQMARWGEIDPAADVQVVADRSVVTRLYDQVRSTGSQTSLAAPSGTAIVQRSLEPSV
jgi:two-component system, oxyanion-binding sensor